MPKDALRFTRGLVLFSIAMVIFGVALALYVLVSRTSSPLRLFCVEGEIHGGIGPPRSWAFQSRMIYA